MVGASAVVCTTTGADGGTGAITTTVDVSGMATGTAAWSSFREALTPMVAATTTVAPTAMRPTIGAAMGLAAARLVADSTAGETRVAKRLAWAALVEAAWAVAELAAWERKRPTGVGGAVAAAQQDVEEHRHCGGTVEGDAHRVAGAANPGTGVDLAEPRRLRHLAVAELVDEAQGEGLAIAVGQAGSALVSSLVSSSRPSWFSILGFDLGENGVGGELGDLLVRATGGGSHPCTHCPRCGTAKAPGGCRRRGGRRCDRHAGTSPHGVFGGRGVGGAAAGVGQQTGPILAYEVVEALAVAVLQGADDPELIY